MFATPTQLTGLHSRETLFGAQITMASLGRWLRTSEQDFKKISSPFLHCDKSRATAFRRQLKKPDRLLVGLSWQSLRTEHGASKSCSLSQLLPALKSENIDFIDLQYGDTTEERSLLKASGGVDIQRLDTIDNKLDIDGLAALVDACDIVLTVSNTTAHLSAALGKPTLVLLPWHTPLWYWHLNSMDSRWYPSAVLLRQGTTGDWSEPVMQAAKIIQGLAHECV